MGTTEDDARAARARQRGDEERRAAEARASAAAATAVELGKEHEELLARSFASLGFVVRDEFIAMAGTVCGLPLVSFLYMLFAGAHPGDARIGAIGAAVAATAGVALVVTVTVVRARMRAAWRLERQWIAQLPFQVRGIDDGIASTSSRQRMRARLTFREPGAPPLDAAKKLLPLVDPGGEVQLDHGELELQATVAGKPEGDLARVRGRRELFRDLVGGVLMPLHAEQPIEVVTLRS